MSTEYPIEIAKYNSAGIRAEAKSAGITHMREVAAGRDERGNAATVFALPTREGWEVRVLDTNADPVWEEADRADFLAATAGYGIDLVVGGAREVES